MSISVAWDNPEHTVILLNIPAGWDWKDIAQANIEYAAMEQTVSGIVDMILDVSKTRLLPTNVISNIRMYSYKATSKTGLIVLVQANPFFRAILRQFGKLVPRAEFRFEFADSLEEARLLLEKTREHRQLAVSPVTEPA